jgi:hypothetical protein
VKAIIESTDRAYVIRIYGAGDALCDIHVVDDVEWKEVSKMCPSFNRPICEVAGIEPERIQCADKNACQGEWEKCRVFIAQFFVSAGIAFEKVA